MKVLTVRPPWADCIGCGSKRFETRSWATRYRGALAIHSGMGDLDEIRAYTGMREFQWALGPLVGRSVEANGDVVWCGVMPEHVHRGEIVAVCRLEDCIATVDLPLSRYRHEERLGDFFPGRFAWLLTGVVRLVQPLKLVGNLGLLDVPDGLARKIREQLPAGVQVDPVILSGLAAA